MESKIKRLAIMRNKEIEVIRDLHTEEYTKLHEQIKRLVEFQKNYKRIGVVVESYKDLTSFISDYLNNVISSTRFENNLNRLLLEFLTAVRAYLDHWETYLKREYGKGSPEVIRFKQATKKEYDGVFAYRFIYELRNYTQHCEMPISSFNAKISKNEQRSLEIFLNRDKLLNGFEWKTIVRNELEKYPDKIELMGLLEEILRCLENIHNDAINLCDTKKLMESAMGIIQFNLDNDDRDGSLVIMEYLIWNKESQPEKLNIEDIPFKFAKFLLNSFLKNV